jgi:hypothetical protein
MGKKSKRVRQLQSHEDKFKTKDEREKEIDSVLSELQQFYTTKLIVGSTDDIVDEGMIEFLNICNEYLEFGEIQSGKIYLNDIVRNLHYTLPTRKTALASSFLRVTREN